MAENVAKKTSVWALKLLTRFSRNHISKVGGHRNLKTTAPMLFKSFTHFLHIKSMASTIRFFFSFVTLRGFDSYKMADFFMKKRDFYFKQPPKIEK